MNIEELLEWAKTNKMFIEIDGDGSVEVSYLKDPDDSYLALASGRNLKIALENAKEELNPVGCSTGLQCEGFQGRCDSKNATRYHQRTAYVKEEMNWVTLCPECAKGNDAHWDDMWKMYYSDCM
jgi:hypothetical protein